MSCIPPDTGDSGPCFIGCPDSIEGEPCVNSMCEDPGGGGGGGCTSTLSIDLSANTQLTTAYSTSATPIDTVYGRSFFTNSDPLCLITGCSLKALGCTTNYTPGRLSLNG